MNKMSPDESIMYLNLDMEEQTSLFSELESPSRNLQLKPLQHNDLLSDSSSNDFNVSQNVEKEFGIQPSILTETLLEGLESNNSSFPTIKQEPSEVGLNDKNFEITDKMILEKKSLRRNKEGKEGRKKITLERNRVAAKNSRLKKKLWHSNLSINLHLLKIKNEEQHQLNSDLINNLRRAREELMKLGPIAQKKAEELREPKASNLPELPQSIDWKELDKMVDGMDFDQLAADAIATNTDPSQFCFTPIDPTTGQTSTNNSNLDSQDFNTLRTINLDFSDK